MRTQKCASCGESKPLREMFRVNEQDFCEPCADKTVLQLQEMKAPLNVTRLVDPSICTMCSGDAGSGSFGLVGGAPLCPACTEKVYNHDFPLWLKLGLAFTLILLVVALVQGAPYFRTGRKMFRAERLVKQKQYEAATPLLSDVVQAAPNCEECLLLFAKAELLTGHPDIAYSTLNKHNGGRFEKSSLFTEVEALFKRVDRAGDLLDKAGKELEAGRNKEALALTQQAHAAYPEWRLPLQMEDQVAIAEAFDNKDYDAFLARAEAIDARDHDSQSVAQVASALACKYATTNDESYRTRAEEMLAKAEELSRSSEPAKQAYQEYAERVRHRLDTRLIIDRAEYDRTVRHVTPQGSK